MVLVPVWKTTSTTITASETVYLRKSFTLKHTLYLEIPLISNIIHLYFPWRFHELGSSLVLCPSVLEIPVNPRRFLPVWVWLGADPLPKSLHPFAVSLKTTGI